MVEKKNVGFFFFLICSFSNWLQAELRKEREELEAQNEEAEMQLQEEEV